MERTAFYSGSKSNGATLPSAFSHLVYHPALPHISANVEMHIHTRLNLCKRDTDFLYRTAEFDF